jgi:hypothetical protein
MAACFFVYFQTKQNTMDIQSLKAQKVNYELYMQFMSSMNEQTKLLKERDENNWTEIKSLQLKMDNLMEKMYQRTTRGKTTDLSQTKSFYNMIN